MQITMANSRVRAFAPAIGLLVALLAGGAAAGDAPKAMKLDLGGGVSMKLALVRAGEFVMGSPEEEKERQKCETPVHKVRITKPFYMGTFEVTNAQYRRFRAAHRSEYLDGDNEPVLWVSWYDADAFCRWLSKKTTPTLFAPSM